MPSSPLKGMFRGGGGKRGSPSNAATAEGGHLDGIDELHSMRDMKVSDHDVDDVLADVTDVLERHRYIATLRDSSSGTVRLAKVWDVKMGPYKKHMVAGHLVPNLKGGLSFLLKKKRRISIEVRCTRKPSTAEDKPASGSPKSSPKKKKGGQESSSVSGGSPARSADGGSVGAAATAQPFELTDDDALFLRIFRKSKGGRAAADHGGDDVSTADDESLIDSEVGSDDSEVSWREHKSFKLDAVTILKVTGRVVEIQTGSGAETVVRDIRFENVKDAEKFQGVVDKMVQMEKERTKRQIARYKKAQKASSPTGDNADDSGAVSAGLLEGSMQPDDQINILVEIVSALDLPIADFVSADPYVVVKMAGKDVHRTAVIPKDLNPIWTLKTGSLFLLRSTVEEFFAATSGLTFVIKDYDAVGKNEKLGEVNVSLDELLKGTGERVEYKIVHAQGFEPKGKDGAEPKNARLFLRMRKASDDDIKFMEEYQELKKSNKYGVYADETFLPFRPPQSKLLKRQTKRNDKLEMLHRVKPFADPEHPDETEWMTKQQIVEDSLKPSTNWVEAGSGDLGKLYVEILGCYKLPNMDSMTTNVRDKTDAFACLVFEDAILMTDVIGDCLSPRWPSWSQRAFAFNIGHPSSTLQIGVFDFDPELSPLQMLQRAAADIHDPIGRIQLHLSTFRPAVEYTLAYPLYFGETAEQRQKEMGTIWLRLRMDWVDPRKALITAATPPPKTLVSVARSIDFQVAHYTTEGPYDETEFNLTTLTGHIEELQSYQRLVDRIKDAAVAVWLWRGHYQVRICNRDILLPLHSLTAFFWGIIVTWDFNTFPAFLAFSVGWVLVAINEHINNNPSPWHQVPRYGPALQFLIMNKVPRFKHNILPNENAEAVEAYNKKVEEKERRYQRDQELAMQHEEEVMKEMGEELENPDAEDIASKKATLLQNLNVNVNPLKPVLYPIQQQLRQYVVYMRIAKSVVLWEEAYFSFWITTASFLCALVLIWIPFGFLFRWISRIVVFVVLGPWMALVDRYYFKEDPNLTDEEKDALVRERFRARFEEARLAASNYQIRKERALKLKSMKKYMFGKFHLRVPQFSEDLFKDVPLPESFAKSYDKRHAEPVRITRRVYGQVLKGDMIPAREIQVRTDSKPGSTRGFFGSVVKGAGGVTNVASLTAAKVPLLGGFLGRKSQDDSAAGAATGEDDEKRGLLSNVGKVTGHTAEKIPLLGGLFGGKSRYDSVSDKAATGDEGSDEDEKPTTSISF